MDRMLTGANVPNKHKNSHRAFRNTQTLARLDNHNIINMLPTFPDELAR